MIKLPEGFLVSGGHCGIKKNGLDLGLIYTPHLSWGVGFFTTNSNCSYSVMISKININYKIKALLVNSGNANCFISKQGFERTQTICIKLANLLKVGEKNILIASTGIIGRRLPIKKIVSALPKLINDAGNNIECFARSITTTDTFIKIVTRSFIVNKRKIRITGVAKGAGMISPHLATMLVFILTDAGIDKDSLRKFSYDALGDSFNSITVDGCMSTNDSIYVLTSSNYVTLTNRKDKNKFYKALKEVFINLAKMIVKDAEGATKFIQLTVSEALSSKQAEIACRAICNSVLFKTAIYGEKTNWGRVIAALGAVGIKLNEDNFKVKSTSLTNKEVRLRVCLGQGKFSKTFYTSDLSPDYVKINSGY